MKRSIAIAMAAALVAFGAFAALAQAHVIFVPYFTPTRIEFQGLQDQYPVNGSMAYDISVKGMAPIASHLKQRCSARTTRFRRVKSV